MATVSNDIGAEIVKLLGLPDEATYLSIMIDFEVNKIVTCSCEFYPSPDSLNNLKKKFAEYEIKLIKKGA